MINSIIGQPGTNELFVSEDPNNKILSDVMTWVRSLKLKKIYHCGELTEVNLKGSGFFVVVGDYAAWEKRLNFIETLLKDIFINCPKDEPLTFISQGSNALLLEYVISTCLIKAKFINLNFIFIDPDYAFAAPKGLEVIKKSHEEFRSKISELCGQDFDPMKRIRFVYSTRLVNLSFQKFSNVIVVDSLPPYAIPLNRRKMNGIQIKKEDLIATNFIMEDSKYSSSISFRTTKFIKEDESRTLPLDLQWINGQEVVLDWGCKILSNGSYRLLFTGESQYFNFMETEDEKLASRLKGCILDLKKKIITSLDQQIKEIKDKSSDTTLSQSNIKVLLDKVQQIAKEHGLCTYFLADYTTDQNEMLSFLAQNAGYHYRKIFRYLPDGEKDVIFETEEIK